MAARNFDKLRADPEHAYRELLVGLRKEFEFDDDIRERNRLNDPWDGIVLLVPPFGEDYWQWAAKAQESAKRGSTIVMVSPSRTGDAWFQDYVLGKADDIRFTPYSIPFIGHSGTGKAIMPAVVAIYRPVAGFVINMDTWVMSKKVSVLMKVSVINDDYFANTLYGHLRSISKARMGRLLSDFLTRR